ncbi:MAG: hypothetical protein KIT57_10470 [Blastocatellales bacterium]|nr:hypothetical protein [Blastocatellales bacterium]
MISTAYYGWRSRGVVEIQIPPETKDYLERLARQVGDLEFLRRSGRGRGRTNRDDEEEAAAGGFLKRENGNFIVFYRGNDRERAEQILADAENSQPRMRAVFGHFPLASEKAGRKMPVYLGNSVADYLRLSGCPSRSIACVRYTVYDDVLLATMFISPQTFAYGRESARATIEHEVAHYTHFDLVSPAYLRHQEVWMTEGLASFTAREEERLDYLMRLYRANRVIPLTEISRYNYNISDPNVLYAEGHSVLKMIEDRRGLERVTRLILHICQRARLEPSIAEVLGVDLAGLNREWMGYLRDATQ